jgi:hypothetical protein
MLFSFVQAKESNPCLPAGRKEKCSELAFGNDFFAKTVHRPDSLLFHPSFCAVFAAF